MKEPSASVLDRLMSTWRHRFTARYPERADLTILKRGWARYEVQYNPGYVHGVKTHVHGGDWINERAITLTDEGLAVLTEFFLSHHKGYNWNSETKKNRWSPDCRIQWNHLDNYVEGWSRLLDERVYYDAEQTRVLGTVPEWRTREDYTKAQ
jgi:hypothetical protein